MQCLISRTGRGDGRRSKLSASSMTLCELTGNARRKPGGRSRAANLSGHEQKGGTSQRDPVEARLRFS
jgi:hypothetical protein